MHRRFFLHTAAVGAAVVLTDGCGGGAAATADLQALARPGLLDLLGDEDVRAIGERYRADHPDEADAQSLRASIHGRPGPLLWLLGAPRTDTDALVRADFEGGRTVTVDGWVLSVTEARQCALLSLAS